MKRSFVERSATISVALVNVGTKGQQQLKMYFLVYHTTVKSALYFAIY